MLRFDRVRTHRYLLFLLSIYLFLSAFVLIQWKYRRVYSVTGDEPHYLVMTDGMVRFHTLEQTLPYTYEFQHRRIYKGGFGTSPLENIHAIPGPHGLFNFHNIGLSLLLVLPYAIGGKLAAKVFMVLLGAMGIVLFWKFSGLFSRNEKIRFFSILATAVGLPLIPGANQIYPDIPAGLIALAGLYWLFTLERRRPAHVEVLYGFAIAFLPWLHIKCAVPGAILLVALCARIYLKSWGGFQRVLRVAVPWVGSVGLLMIYNQYAFGNSWGPYGQGSLEFSKSSLMVLLGLHLDQNQGFLLQNPVHFVGLFSLASLFVFDRFAATTAVLVFLSLLCLNAAHPNWYGGGSFSGRFEWGAALLFGIATLLGMTRLGNIHRRLFFSIVFAGGLVQFVTFLRYTFKHLNLYNRSLPNQDLVLGLESYSLFYRPICKWLPAFYNTEWAFSHGPNYFFVFMSIGFIVWGWLRVTQDPISKNSMTGETCDSLAFPNNQI